MSDPTSTPAPPPALAAPTDGVDWRAVFLDYRDLIIAEEGIDYLGRGDVGEPDEQDIISAVIAEHDVQRAAREKAAHDAATVESLLSNPDATYIVDKGAEGFFLVKGGVESPIKNPFES